MCWKSLTSTGARPAHLVKVTFKIIENADSLLMSLQSGAIDLCAHLTSTQVAQLGEDFQTGGGYHEPGAGPLPQQRRGTL